MRSFFALLALAAVATAQDTLESVKAAFESAGIVGDVIPAFDPSVLLTVTFTNPDGSPLSFTAGTLLTPARTCSTPPAIVPCCVLTLRRVVEAARRPTFSISPADPSTTFLVAEVDPDAPTPQSPTSAQIRHFLGPNFSVVGSTLANTTAALSDYRGPSPPAGSDPHRFVVRHRVRRKGNTDAPNCAGTRSYSSRKRTRE